MTLKLILDRFEDEICVCLDFNDKRYLIPRKDLEGIEINDIFTVEYDGEAFSFPVILTEETQRAKDEVHEKMKRLFKKRSEDR